MLTLVVICLAAAFGYVAADRWLTLDPLAVARDQGSVVLCSVSAFVALTVHLTLG